MIKTIVLVILLLACAPVVNAATYGVSSTGSVAGSFGALGTLALQDPAAVAITGGTITGVTGLSPILSGTTGSIGGGVLLAGACTSGTVAVTSSTTAMAVEASPVTYPGDGVTWLGYVSTAGTVTVKVCAIVGLTPGATTYNVRIIQ